MNKLAKENYERNYITPLTTAEALNKVYDLDGNLILPRQYYTAKGYPVYISKVISLLRKHKDWSTKHSTALREYKLVYGTKSYKFNSIWELSNSVIIPLAESMAILTRKDILVIPNSFFEPTAFTFLEEVNDYTDEL